MRTRNWTSLGHAMGATTALLVSARAAAAEPSLATLPIELSAPPACIDAAMFRAHLLALPAAPGKTEPPRAITVHIEEHDGTFAGALRVAHANGTATTREVTSERCVEVTDALEFVAALALGLDAHVSPSATPPATPPPGRPAIETPAAPPPVAAPPPARWHFSLGPMGGFISVGGPEPLFGVAVSLGAALDRSGPFAPELLLAGISAGGSGFATPPGTASVDLTVAALEACPLRLALGLGFALRPCVEATVGSLTATAKAANLVGDPSQSRPWGAAALLGRAEWELGHHFLIDAEGGPVFPFTRDRFFLTPDTDVYRVSNVGWEARVSFSLVL